MSEETYQNQQFIEGWRAFWNNQETFDCPYYPEAKNMVDRNNWIKGFMEAHKEATKHPSAPDEPHPYLDGLVAMVQGKNMRTVAKQLAFKLINARQVQVDALIDAIVDAAKDELHRELIR